MTIHNSIPKILKIPDFMAAILKNSRILDFPKGDSFTPTWMSLYTYQRRGISNKKNLNRQKDIHGTLASHSFPYRLLNIQESSIVHLQMQAYDTMLNICNVLDSLN